MKTDTAVTPAERTRGAGALGTGLDILEALAANDPGMGVTAVARLLDLDKGNVHRLLQVLGERGYVEQDPRSKAYRVSAQVVTLAGSLLRGMDLLGAAKPVMRRLSGETGEAVHLARRIRTGGVYVARERQLGGVVTVETEIGAHPIIHATATGKALFCMAGAEELAAAVAQPMTAYTPRTITSVDELLLDLAKVQKRGYAIDDEELNLDVRCVAAPIFDMYGMPMASVGISGPVTRVSLARVDELGRQVHAAAAQVTRELGGYDPTTKENQK